MAPRRAASLPALITLSDSLPLWKKETGAGPLESVHPFSIGRRFSALLPYEEGIPRTQRQIEHRAEHVLIGKINAVSFGDLN